MTPRLSIPGAGTEPLGCVPAIPDRSAINGRRARRVSSRSLLPAWGEAASPRAFLRRCGATPWRSPPRFRHLRPASCGRSDPSGRRLAFPPERRARRFGVDDVASNHRRAYRGGLQPCAHASSATFRAANVLRRGRLRCNRHCADSATVRPGASYGSRSISAESKQMGKYVLAWLLGVPAVVLAIIYFFFH